MNITLRDPWLVAAWPGMGAVAQIAAAHLIQTLGAEAVDEVPAGSYFDVRAVAVDKGMVQAANLPRSILYGWKNPSSDGRDLLIFLGEQQPQVGGYAFCKELLDIGERLGVTRVLTFAAMATPMHPSDDPRVLAVVTRRKLLTEVAEHGGRAMASGEVGGLNGVLLAAAATREVDGICLLGEFPFFASRAPNPKASRAVLRVFTGLAGIDIDLTGLDEQVEAIETELIEAFDAVQEAGQSVESLGERAEDEEQEPSPAEGKKARAASKEVMLDAESEQRIESLFEAAQQDRARALELKAELDRLGVFKRYEDRFLDLFRKAD